MLCFCEQTKGYSSVLYVATMCHKTSGCSCVTVVSVFSQVFMNFVRSAYPQKIAEF